MPTFKKHSNALSPNPYHRKVKWIKNWKLALVALIFFCFLLGLGCWQLSRAQQKQILLNSFHKRIEHAPLTLIDLQHEKIDARFYRVSLVGQFDNQHTLLLDNKIFHGQVGYEIYTPFKVKGLNRVILVDRGFIPLTKDRKILPPIQAILHETTLVGLLNLPPTYFSFGSIADTKTINWPLRIEYVNLKEISKFTNTPLFPYILSLEPHHPAAYPTEWQIVIMGPERHIGYAVQWFALALTLLILFTVLNRSLQG